MAESHRAQEPLVGDAEHDPGDGEGGAARERDTHTVTGSWNATTIPVFVTKTAAAHAGEACSWVTSTSGTATSGTFRQNT